VTTGAYTGGSCAETVQRPQAKTITQSLPSLTQPRPSFILAIPFLIIALSFFVTIGEYTGGSCADTVQRPQAPGGGDWRARLFASAGAKPYRAGPLRDRSNRTCAPLIYIHL